MNDLSARKQLLLSKAGLQRLRLRHEAAQLRRSIASPSGLMSLAGSGPGKAVLLGAALAFLGRGRAMGLVSGALTALSMAKTAAALIARFRAR